MAHRAIPRPQEHPLFTHSRPPIRVCGRAAARCCRTEPAPVGAAPSSGAPLQDTLQQLLNALKSSDAVLNQNHGQLQAALAELDPVQHSLGYLWLL